ncbi:glycosyltransferase [Sphingomonas bacterium]|uniref:glycosyltransferase n=1 Tax=Sphingomonas bacterium TaxID=1895847 RepID=UPI00260C45BC|nr:glycosyltransferase [Sphingomonas bacterium]MDB5678443.1 glycosyltransferase family 1 protein [Sphingomonas bacterium]
MRIVDVCAFYTPAGGGVRTYVERKLKAGPAAGHEIVILAPGAEDAVTEVAPGAILATIAAPEFPLDRNYRYFDDEARLHAALDRWRPDLVEVASPWTSAAMVGRWQGSAPRSLIMHCDFLSAYPYRWLQGLFSIETIDRRMDWYWRHLRRLNRQFDFVVSASDDLTQRLRAGGVDKARTIQMGVEPGIFSPTHRDPAVRAALLTQCGLGEDATLLIGLGRMAPEKRWPMVCEAVLAAGSSHAAGLVLFGAGRDRARIVRAALGSPHIVVAPPVADRAELATMLASSDALIHGCEAETYCMVAAEGAASGLPLIVPDRGGASDHYRAGCGAHYAACDVRDMARVLTDFLAGDPAAHRALSSARAASVRTMDSHFDDMFALYAGTVFRQAAA